MIGDGPRLEKREVRVSLAGPVISASDSSVTHLCGAALRCSFDDILQYQASEVFMSVLLRNVCYAEEGNGNCT